jgi:hypothetical protein
MLLQLACVVWVFLDRKSMANTAKGASKKATKPKKKGSSKGGKGSKKGAPVKKLTQKERRAVSEREAKKVERPNDIDVMKAVEAATAALPKPAHATPPHSCKVVTTTPLLSSLAACAYADG